MCACLFLALDLLTGRWGLHANEEAVITEGLPAGGPVGGPVGGRSDPLLRDLTVVAGNTYFEFVYVIISIIVTPTLITKMKVTVIISNRSASTCSRPPPLSMIFQP